MNNLGGHIKGAEIREHVVEPSRQPLSDVYRIRGSVPTTGCAAGDLIDARLELQDGAPEWPRVEIRS